MKLTFEPILPTKANFLRIAHHSPENPCGVFWHYHPECELVFVPGGSGQRRIGDHLGHYTEGDLVLIGSSVPHLSFGFLARQPHEEIVIQFSLDQLLLSLQLFPECAPLTAWLRNLRTGIVFGNSVKLAIGDQIQQLLRLPPVEQLLSFLHVLNWLSQQQDIVYLNPVLAVKYHAYDQERIDRIYHYVQSNYACSISMDEVVSLTGLSQAAFCRFFKKMVNVTFTEFLTEFRIQKACQHLLSGEAVTTVAYACGFNNISHFNVSFKKITGSNPGQYRKKWRV